MDVFWLLRLTLQCLWGFNLQTVSTMKQAKRGMLQRDFMVASLTQVFGLINTINVLLLIVQLTISQIKDHQCCIQII